MNTSSKSIEAILFDMGGTLRSTRMRLPEINKEKIHEMVLLLGMDIDEWEFIQLLQKHDRDYRDWARKTRLELDEVELWKRWMLPDWPSDKVSPIALELNQLWRDATGKHVVFPETKETVLALFRRGYRLGLVSNTTSSVEAPHILKELGIAGCFDTVILSCDVGIRKPDPSILIMAADRMGVRPENCAYIGDQPRRDVIAAREAGFARTVILRDLKKDPPDLAQESALIPDHTIYNLSELLDIFPPCSASQPATVYDASLSTMWFKKNFSAISDFIEASRRLGFARIELNHQMDSAILAGIDLKKVQVSSVHEPCPADISTDELKKRDWMISSPDEHGRRHGVESIKRTIDLAHQLAVDVIVVHSGMTSNDMTPEKKLRGLYKAGQADTDEYRKIKQSLIEDRASLIGPRFEALKKSLLELLDYARPLRIRLGLENRFHYFDIPTPDEMEILLGLGDSNRLGFILDVGHAQAMDRLGFFPLEGWLKRFSSRIIGVHLHDVKGVDDHFAPGLGEVDFELIGEYLPEDAFRTLEVQTINSPVQLRSGLEYLVQHGCIKTYQKEDH